MERGAQSFLVPPPRRGRLRDSAEVGIGGPGASVAPEGGKSHVQPMPFPGASPQRVAGAAVPTSNALWSWRGDEFTDAPPANGHRPISVKKETPFPSRASPNLRIPTGEVRQWSAQSSMGLPIQIPSRPLIGWERSRSSNVLVDAGFCDCGSRVIPTTILECGPSDSQTLQMEDLRL